MFDIKNPNSFLGGQNVHNLIIIGLLIYIIFKLMKNSEKESSYAKPPKRDIKADTDRQIAYQKWKAAGGGK